MTLLSSGNEPITIKTEITEETKETIKTENSSENKLSPNISNSESDKETTEVKVEVESEKKIIDTKEKESLNDKDESKLDKEKNNKDKEENKLIENESPIDRNLRLKRENHNALERKRRVYQKSKLEELKNRLPPLNSKKPSTIVIMCKAIEYIDSLKASVDDLKNKIDEDELEYTKSEMNDLKKKISLLIKENTKLKYKLECALDSNNKNSETLKETIIDDINLLSSNLNSDISRNLDNTIDNKRNDITNNISNNFNIINFRTSPSMNINIDTEILNTSTSSSTSATTYISPLTSETLQSNKTGKHILESDIDSLSQNKKQKIGSADSLHDSTINDDKIKIDSIETTTPLSDCSSNIIKDSALISDINDNQNKSMDINSTLNPNLNSSVAPNVNTCVSQLPIFNSIAQVTQGNNLMISSLSSQDNNQSMKSLSLQYSNSIKSIPLSTPPTNNLLKDQTNQSFQSLPIMQEPSPIQVHTKTNSQPVIIQQSTDSSTLTPIATPVHSPNQINQPLNVTNSVPLTNKVSSFNPSPLMNIHHPIPQTTTYTSQTQGMYSSNLNYQRTEGFPIQQSSHMTIQNQVSPLNHTKLDTSPQIMQMSINNPLINSQMQMITPSNQIQSSSTDNSNLQYSSNVAVSGQSVINISQQTTIPLQLTNNTVTPNATPLTNISQPNYFSQVNNVKPLDSFGANNSSLQVIQQPISSTIVGQNMVNSQISNNNGNQNNITTTNPNLSNNIIYYY